MAEKVKKKKASRKKKANPSPVQSLMQVNASDDGDEVDKRPSIDDELEWCIRQLETGLLRPKVSSDQKREAQHLIKKLSSTKTPLPRKRQLMHNHFGNYRQKMREHPLPPVTHCTTPSLMRKATDDASDGKFYKKTSTNTSFVSTTGNQPFTFNFDISD